MRVTVKLFATLSQYGHGKRAGAPIEVELPARSTLRDLSSQLKIPPEATRVAFVNGIIQEPDCKLKEGDQVGMFPPIGGG